MTLKINVCEESAFTQISGPGDPDTVLQALQ